MIYNKIIKLNNKDFNVIDKGLNRDYYNNLISFFGNLLIDKSNSIITIEDTDKINKAKDININYNWFIEVKIQNYKLMPLLNIYHEYITISLISDKNEEFLLFSIGAEAGYDDGKYEISIPDMISYKCLGKQTDKGSCKGTEESYKIHIGDNNFISKIYFFLILININSVYEDYEDYVDDGDYTHFYGYLCWITKFNYGINVSKELKHLIKTKKQIVCKKECKENNYNCWHFALLFFEILKKKEYKINLNSVNEFKNSLTSWNSVKGYRREYCCIRNMFIDKGLENEISEFINTNFIEKKDDKNINYDYDYDDLQNKIVFINI